MAAFHVFMAFERERENCFPSLFMSLDIALGYSMSERRASDLMTSSGSSNFVYKYLHGALISAS
jgi:hypothetical protein